MTKHKQDVCLQNENAANLRHRGNKAGPAEPAAFRGLRHLVGNTPLLKIHFTFRGQPRTLYVKSENMNMTGSIKDRMAFHILRSAYAEGSIRPGDRIIEATSGNAGISFAAIGRALGHQVTIFMPDWLSRERVDLIQSLGAEVCPVTREQGGFLGSIRLTEELAATEKNIFLPRQFFNLANIEAHERTTGPEIWWQLYFQGLIPDAFIAGVGTGGTIMGVGRFLRKMNPKIKIHPLEPAESPTMSTGRKIGQHRIQGISDEFIPAIVKLSELDEIVAVNDGDAILLAQKLAREIGLAVGISSGANFIGAVKVQEKIGGDKVVVTVFPDCNKKYLSTDLLSSEPEREDYLAPHVRFTGLHAYKRVCRTCCDDEECEQKQLKKICG